MISEFLALIALSTLLYGAVSGKLSHSPITPPMTFVSLGIIAAVVDPGLITVMAESEMVVLLAEITLVIVLFTDAARIDLNVMFKEYGLAVRLLALGLPLTIGLGGLAAFYMFRGEVTIWDALLIGAILAPTDAALGQAVVSFKRIPVRIRQTLNVESGLNDGIALPVVLLFLALALGTNHEGDTNWTRFVLLQLTLGPLAGAAVGYFGGGLVARTTRSGSMDDNFQRICALSLALLAYAMAELLGGNGFIAAFVAGLVVGNTSRGVCSCLFEFAEAEGQLLTLIVFLIVGAVMVPETVEHVSVKIVVYAIASLTVIRMLPVALSLFGSRLKPQSYLFLGWFGPRGIASVLFLLVVIEEAGRDYSELVFTTVVVTVLFSIFLHGATAFPLSQVYSNSIANAHTENQDKPEMPLRMS